MNPRLPNANQRFSDRLVSVESPTPDAREKLEKELHAMFNKELRTTRRIFFGIVATFSAIIGLVCATLMLTEQGMPNVSRLGLGVGSLFGLAWAIVLGRICWSGNLNPRLDGKRMAQMAWTFTVLMMTFFLYVGMSMEDRVKGIMMIVYGLPFLIGAGVYWLTYRIEQAELTTREKLLELELQFAERFENTAND